MYALNLDDNKRILSATFEEFAPAEYPRVETLPEGNINDYLYKNNEYVYDPLPTPEPPEPYDPKTELEQVKANIDYIVMCTEIDMDELV